MTEDKAPPPEPSPLVQGSLLGFFEHGLAAHEARELAYSIAPEEGSQHATLALPLRVLASFRLDGVRFARSFIEPEAAPEIEALLELIEQHPEGLVTLFGHADPVGSEVDNKALSGRRARALHALLTHDSDSWNELHQKPVEGDEWGLASITAMLRHLGYEPGADSSRYTEETKAAVRAFQTDQGLAAEGNVDEPTRKALIGAYMEALVPSAVAKERFLGEGKDTQGKCAYQGCSELNLRRRPSKEQEKAHAKDKAARNAYHAINRRITVLLIDRLGAPTADAWPCPRASEGVDDCKARLWSDEQRRGAAGDEERDFWKGRDTFRCRFYHRLHLRTVAEGVGPPQPVDIVLKDIYGHPAMGVQVLLSVGGIRRVVSADAEGHVRSSMPEGPVSVDVLSGGDGFVDDAFEHYAQDPLTDLPKGPSGGSSFAHEARRPGPGSALEAALAALDAADRQDEDAYREHDSDT